MIVRLYMLAVFFVLQVSDRQSYLVVSLVLCLSLGFLLCLQCCCGSSPSPSTTAIVALPKSNNYPSPKRFVRLTFDSLHCETRPLFCHFQICHYDSLHTVYYSSFE